jgi:CBS domain-containing protein
MLTQGTAVEPLTQFISVLNELLTRRIIELELPRAVLNGVKLCWIALGSEGRYEQTLSSDQDNGIIFSHPPAMDPEAARQVLLARAASINRALDGCGFSLCKGNVMAGNPTWCLSLSEWKRKFASWIDHGDPESLLNASIFFDFRPVYGDSVMAGELREWLKSKASRNPRFLHQMAANALRNSPPLGFLRDFKVEHGGDHPDTIDLKLRGTHLFVDAARIFGLAAQVPQTSTRQRLRACAGPLNVRQAEAEAWIEAFDFVLLLRLRNQVAKRKSDMPADNYLDPRGLNDLERDFLKQSLRQAQKIQSRLALDYRL